MTYAMWPLVKPCTKGSAVGRRRQYIVGIVWGKSPICFCILVLGEDGAAI
jgi:hypothetical protein